MPEAPEAPQSVTPKNNSICQMYEELRLHQVARELKVGQTTIVEYLEKKGIKVENAPSTLIEPHVYEVLDKEFGANKAETVNIREKINQKLEAVSLGNRKDGAPAEDDADFKKEVITRAV